MQSLNVKLSNSQLKKFKLATKNATEVTLKLLSNIIGDSNNETNSIYNLSSTERQVLKFRKSFANNSSANIKFSKLNCLKQYDREDVLEDFLDHGSNLDYH